MQTNKGKERSFPPIPLVQIYDNDILSNLCICIKPASAIHASQSFSKILAVKINVFNILIQMLSLYPKHAKKASVKFSIKIH